MPETMPHLPFKPAAPEAREGEQLKSHLLYQNFIPVATTMLC